MAKMGKSGLDSLAIRSGGPGKRTSRFTMRGVRSLKVRACQREEGREWVEYTRKKNEGLGL